MISGLWPKARWELNPAGLGRLVRAFPGGAARGLFVAGLYIAPPGAYRKLTVHLLERDGGLAAVARIPLDPLSEEAVRNEAVVLKGLEAISSLDGSVPKLLEIGSWNHRALSLLSAGTTGHSTAVLGLPHLRFLKLLHLGTVSKTVLRETGMMRRHAMEVPAIRGALTQPWPDLMDAATECLTRTFGDREIPASTAHRDFTPWNCRISGNDLFVFDWEMGSEQTTPLFDALHFCSVQAAFRGRPLEIPVTARRLLREIWPEGDRYLNGLVLAYLTDIGFHYAKSRALRPDQGKDTLLNWYRLRLEEALQGRLAI